MQLPLETETFSDLANECRRLCQISGQSIQRYSGDIQIRSKGKRDWVTAVDEGIQREIELEIAKTYPDSLVLGEEDVTDPQLRHVNAAQFSLPTFASRLGSAPEESGEVVWIIDPIDGTNNFIHGFPYYAVSIAATINNVVVAGAIQDVCRNQCYWAYVGGGAYRDDSRISTSGCTDISQSMVVGSIPRLFEQYPSCHEIFRSVSDRCQSVRRLGSAALNMAYLSDGKLDAYWALSLQIWDIAAGALIMKQAGGSQQFAPDPVSGGLSYLGASSDALMDQMKSIIQGASADV